MMRVEMIFRDEIFHLSFVVTILYAHLLQHLREIETLKTVQCTHVKISIIVVKFNGFTIELFSVTVEEVK